MHTDNKTSSKRQSWGKKVRYFEVRHCVWVDGLTNGEEEGGRKCVGANLGKLGNLIYHLWIYVHNISDSCSCHERIKEERGEK